MKVVLDLRIDDFCKTFRIGFAGQLAPHERIEVVESLAHDLDVLLRHRPRSIARRAAPEGSFSILEPTPAHERMSLEQARNVEIHGYQMVCWLQGIPEPDDNDVREYMGWPLIEPDSPDPALRAAAGHEQAWKSRSDA